MRNDKMKRWEIALALSLGVAVCHALVSPAAAGCQWWGVVFPGLGASPEAAVAAWRGAGVRLGGVEVRLRLLDWLAGLF